MGSINRLSCFCVAKNFLGVAEASSHTWYAYKRSLSVDILYMIYFFSPKPAPKLLFYNSLFPSVFMMILSILCHLQFYCSKDKEYNDLATIFFNTQVLWISKTLFSSICLLLCCFRGFPSFDWWLLCLQDDAIRNLFSAKTAHEYSAQSLLTFLVHLSLLLYLNQRRKQQCHFRKKKKEIPMSFKPKKKKTMSYLKLH